jgi:hypothetical protein
MQSDAEHQQNHANLGKLPGEIRVCNETGGEGSYGNAREQVTDQRGEL